MMDDLRFLTTVYRLKDEKRTGWEKRNVSYPESVAAHSYGVAFLTMYLCPDGVDQERAVQMAILHDLPEAITGDIAAGDLDAHERAEKHAAERAGLERLLATSEHDAAALGRLWNEYEARETPEAVFVKDMDLLDMVLQATIYDSEQRYADSDDFHQDHDSLDEFFEYALPKFKTDIGRDLGEQLQEAYRR